MSRKTCQNTVKQILDKFLHYHISPRGLKVLEKLGRELHQSNVAKELEISRQSVNYWAKKLVKDGLIREKMKDVITIYELTTFGQKILTWSEDVGVGVGVPCVLEDFAVKFRVVCDESSLDWAKLGEPRNWVKLGLKLGGGVSVVKTSKHVIVHPGRLVGFSPEELVLEAGRVVEAVRVWLEDHGVVLRAVCVPVHKPVFRFFSRQADELSKRGTFIGEEGSVDCSPPERVPHVEFRGVETARNYLEMPNRVARVEKKLDSIDDRVNAVVNVLERLSGPLNRMADVFEKQALEFKRRKTGRADKYVS